MAYAFVQQKDVTNASASSTSTGNFASSITAGNLIWVTCRVANGMTANTPTDTLGHTYTLIGSCTTTGISVLYHWYAKSTSAGTNSVSITTTGGPSNLDLYASEWSGFDTSAPLLGHNELWSNPGTGSANSAVSGTATITLGSMPGAGVLGFDLDVNGRTHTNPGDEGTGFTALANAFGGFGMPEHKRVTADGTYQATFDDPAFDQHLVVMAIFGEAPGAPTINTQPSNQTVFDGGSATFTVSATASAGGLSYQWQDNSSGSFANIGGATSQSLTVLASLAINGRLYRVVVTDSNGSSTSNSATLFVRSILAAWPPSNTPLLPPFKRNKSTLWLLDPNNWGPSTLDIAKWFAQELTTTTGTTPTGTLARTNANDTSSATALAVPNGTLARTNANDTSAAAGTTTIVSTLARTNANDISTASATPVSPGSLARTNANDTLAASGNTWPSSTLARTNADDTLAASGSVGSAADGSLARTNANDTSSAAGNTGILSTLARTNANDTLASSGSPVGGGTLARSNNNDTSAASAISTIVGTSSTTNANDTLSASGSAGSVPVGTLTYTNNNDTVSSSGSTTILSSLARTNNNDTLAASGSAGSGGSGVTTRLPLTGVGS